jgi:hypothetical protein
MLALESKLQSTLATIQASKHTCTSPSFKAHSRDEHPKRGKSKARAKKKPHTGKQETSKRIAQAMQEESMRCARGKQQNIQ